MDNAVSSKEDRDSIIRNIDELLLKLTEYGEESLLMTGDGTSLHVTGSEKGKRFLTVNRHVAEQFHKFCFDVQEKASKLEVKEKTPLSLLRFPVAPKTAVTVTNIKEVDSDFEVDQEETVEALQTKDSSFPVFNIGNQECQSRKLTTSLQDASSPGKPKQKRQNIRVQVQRGNKTTEIRLLEKSDQLINKDFNSEVCVPFTKSGSRKTKSHHSKNTVSDETIHSSNSESEMPSKGESPGNLTMKSKQASLNSRQVDADHTHKGQAANSQTITNHLQSSVNYVNPNLSSNSDKTASPKPGSEARNITCESKETHIESSQAGHNTSKQSDSYVHGAEIEKTLSCDAASDQSVNEEDNSEPIDSVDTFVNSPGKACDLQICNNNPSVSKENKQKPIGDSDQEAACLASSASYQASVKDIQHNPVTDRIRDFQGTTITHGRDPGRIVCGEQTSDEPRDNGFDVGMEMDISNEGGTIVDQTSPVKPSVDSPKTKRKEKVDTERGLKKRKIPNSPQSSPTRKKIRNNPDKETGSDHMETKQGTLNEDESVTSTKITSAKERSKVTSPKQGSEVTSVKERSEVTTVNERSEAASAKECLKVTSEEKSSKMDSTKETSKIKPSKKSSDVALAKETSKVNVGNHDNSPPSKSSEKVKVKGKSKSPSKSTKTKQKLQVKLPLKSRKEGDKAGLFKKSLVVELEKIPDTATLQLMGKSPERDICTSEILKKPIAENNEMSASELKKSPVKVSNIKSSESKNLTPKIEAKLPSESKKPIERTASKSKKPESKKPVPEVCDHVIPNSELKKSPHKIKVVSTLESNRPDPGLTDLAATESKEPTCKLTDTLTPDSKKSTPNDILASESKMSTLKVTDITASKTKVYTLETTNKHSLESTLPSVASESKATNSKDKKDTGNKSSQKFPAKIIIKQPVRSVVAGKGDCDLKNFKIDLKALAMGLASQKQKKP